MLLLGDVRALKMVERWRQQQESTLVSDCAMEDGGDVDDGDGDDDVSN